MQRLGHLERAVLRDLRRMHEHPVWGKKIDFRKMPRWDRRRYGRALARLERKGLLLRQSVRYMLRLSPSDRMRGRTTHVALMDGSHGQA